MLFEVALGMATFFCSLVAGFLFAFAAVVMPGIGRLDDGDFIHAFQVIDGVIQRAQPLFLVVWVGSAPALAAAAVLGVWTLSGVDRVILIAGALLYVLGVQAPTFTINVPLNNQLQRLNPSAMDASARQRARRDFERRWNQANVFRTACANLVSALLIVLLLRA